jgi:spore coat polysaccharide biosynthesis protein SpsF
MRVVAVIQARMTSTRLPGKVLADLEGEPMLARVVARLRAAERVSDVWVACTDRVEDAPVAGLVRRLDAGLFRGAEHDVLGRYVATARESRADVVIRVTADCPLIDPRVVDRVVGVLLDGRATLDYAANVLQRTYPRGLDVEALYGDALLRAERVGVTPEAREHVTLAIRTDPAGHFATANVVAETDDSDLRWTVDTAEDLDHLRRLYREVGLTDPAVDYRRAVRWCRSHPAEARHDDHPLTWDPARGRDSALPAQG